MNNGWQYANVKLPMVVLWIDTARDAHEIVKAIVGHDCIVCGMTSTSSACGPWEEGDIDFIDSDGLGYVLSYDFMELDKATGRIFRYGIGRSARI